MKINTCSCCASNGEHEVRYVACLAQTHYSEKDGDGRNHTNNDSLSIWEIALCSKCQPKECLPFLKKGLKKTSFRVGSV